jgi:hypothetical protein
VFYLPFFLLAYFISFLFGLPLDGYAPLFQFCIVAAHLFYFLIGLAFLNKVMLKLNLSHTARTVSLLSICLSSNVFFYLVYDFSVAHIFGFFGVSWFIYLLNKWNQLPDPTLGGWKIIGQAFVVLSLLVITRPTNALVVLAIPLFVEIQRFAFFFYKNIHWRKVPWIYLGISLVILFIPLVLWKIQTSNWLVYSYGDEQLSLSKPNLGKFLFSVQKGWWFWSPMLLVMTLLGTWYYTQKNKIKGFYFLMLILFIAYIFSCWWMWTFGMGLGQRPMIDFYPIIIVAFAGFMNQLRHVKWWTLAFVPFIALNMVQAHQINKFILVGGQTTWVDYKNNFLRIKRIAPQVEVPNNWKLWKKLSIAEESYLNESNHYSTSITLEDAPKNAIYIVKTKIGGVHESRNLTLVAADTNTYYQAEYIGQFLYKKPRKMSFLFKPAVATQGPVKFYFWNSGTNEHATVEHIEVLVYLHDNLSGF